MSALHSFLCDTVLNSTLWLKTLVWLPIAYPNKVWAPSHGIPSSTKSCLPILPAPTYTTCWPLRLCLSPSLCSSKSTVFRAWSPEQQQQHRHLGNCHTNRPSSMGWFWCIWNLRAIGLNHTTPQSLAHMLCPWNLDFLSSLTSHWTLSYLLERISHFWYCVIVTSLLPDLSVSFGLSNEKEVGEDDFESCLRLRFQPWAPKDRSGTFIHLPFCIAPENVAPKLYVTDFHQSIAKWEEKKR